MALSPRLLRPRASASGFDPRSIGGLRCWLDANDVTTMFENSDGTTAASSGSPVGYWGDKSGSGFHVTQSGSTSNKPTLSLGNTKARPAIAFSLNSQQNLLYQSNPLASSASGSVMSVVRFISFPAATHGAPVTAFGTNVSADHYPFGGSLDAYLGFGSTARFTINNSATIPFSATHVSGIISSSNNWRLWANKSLIDTRTSNTVAWGASPSIGGRDTPSGFWNGVVCEVLLYNFALSAAQRLAVTDYLMAKWGIA
jgi:hypothetical protein